MIICYYVLNKKDYMLFRKKIEQINEIHTKIITITLSEVNLRIFYDINVLVWVR